MWYLELLAVIVLFVWYCLPGEEEIQQTLDRELIPFGLEVDDGSES